MLALMLSFPVHFRRVGTPGCNGWSECRGGPRRRRMLFEGWGMQIRHTLEFRDGRAANAGYTPRRTAEEELPNLSFPTWPGKKTAPWRESRRRGQRLRRWFAFTRAAARIQCTRSGRKERTFLRSSPL